MSSLDQDDVEMPKMKTINKPKNLKKRRRDLPEDDDATDESKKAKTEGDDEESEYVLNSKAESAIEAQN